MVSWDIGAYSHEPDHAIRLTGFHEGYPTFDLDCLHPTTDEQFYTDADGETYDDCLIHEWWDAVGLSDLTGSSQAIDRHGRCLIWTIYPEWLGGEPQLTGWPEHQAWREAIGEA